MYIWLNALSLLHRFMIDSRFLCKCFSR